MIVVHAFAHRDYSDHNGGYLVLQVDARVTLVIIARFAMLANQSRPGQQQSMESG